MTDLSALMIAAMLAVGGTPTLPVAPRAPGVSVERGNEAAADGTSVARYLIEAVDFKALDETGVDFLGSDEVIARFSAYGHSTYSGIYGNVDSGETHSFRSGQQCVFPAIDTDQAFNHHWFCNGRGGAAPVTFQIALYEYDGTVRQFLTNSLRFCLQGGNDVLEGCDNDSLLASTTIGTSYVTYSEAELAEALPTVGGSVMRVVPIGSAYQVNLRLTRVRSSMMPPVGDEPPVGPVGPNPPCVPGPNHPCP